MRQQLNIAIINHSFPPDIGGGETHVLQLATGLARSGHAVTVVTDLPHSGKRRVNQALPYTIIELPGFREIEQGGGNIAGATQQLKQALAGKPFDIIYVHNFMPALALSFVQDFLSAKIVFTFHSTPIPDEGKVIGLFRGDWEMEVAFARRIMHILKYDAVICPSQYYFHWALQLGAIPSKTHLVYHAVETKSYNVDRSETWRNAHNLPHDKFLVLCPVRMIRRKGVLDLIRAAALLDNRFHFLLLSSIYNHSEETRVDAEMLVRELDLEARFDIRYDAFSGKQMAEAYSHADVVVLPSHVEGLGLVLLEALASGVPVIGTDTAGINEVIQDGINGLLVEVKSPSSIAKAISRLQSDPLLSKKLSKNGLASIHNQFSAERQMIEINDILLSLVSITRPKIA